MPNSVSTYDDCLSLLRDHLARGGYDPVNASQYISAARRFLAFLRKEEVAIADVQPDTVERYLRVAKQEYSQCHGHLPTGKWWRYGHTRGINMLLRLVHGRRPIRPTVTSLSQFCRDVCEEYVTSMTEMRGLARETISDYGAEACRFLDWLGGRASDGFATITVKDVDAYMKHRAGLLCRRSLKALGCRLRSFLRWLQTPGQTKHDFSITVIWPSLYAFETIPSALRPQDVDRILSVAREDRTPKGLRDFAILMLLARYGLRAGEIAGLRLDDMDWRKEVIRIRQTKTGVTSYLPLLPEVGSAILRYLQRSRPKTSFREVFICGRVPYRPFANGSSLYALVRPRIDDANVLTEGKRGPHAFRHARAVSLIRAFVPLKEIGDVLGHRTTESTLPYLKLATEDLRGIALDLPEAVKP